MANIETTNSVLGWDCSYGGAMWDCYWVGEFLEWNEMKGRSARENGVVWFQGLNFRICHIKENLNI